MHMYFFYIPMVTILQFGLDKPYYPFKMLDRFRGKSLYNETEGREEGGMSYENWYILTNENVLFSTNI